MIRRNYLKTFLFLAVISFSTIHLLHAQSDIVLPKIIPPSPDAAALARYGEIPVDYSTGVPKIEIPLYTLYSGALSLPIGISYHASGIKVRDIASTVGLGWVLNAGGAISRTVIGHPDEANINPSSYKNHDDVLNAILNPTGQMLEIISQLENLTKGNFESQSDRYAYNFEGHAGIFRFDRISGDIKVIPYSPVKITRNIENNGSVYYSIVDENGDQYIFRAADVSVQTGEVGATSTWSLTKIISANHTDEIEFYYSSGESIAEISISSTVNAGVAWTGPTPGVGNRNVLFSSTMLTTTHYPKRLDSIVTKNSVALFEYLSDRYDGRQMRLTKIKILDKVSREIIKQVSFSQSYFGDAASHSARMRLDGLQVTGATNSQSETYGFKYNTDISMPGYYFDGTTTVYHTLPEDYWGYYAEGPGGETGNIPIEYLTFLNGSEKTTYGGKSLNPSPYLMGAYNIKEVDYPTGGKTIFEFEPNKTTDPNFYDYQNSNNGVVGGLRVKTIKSYSGNNPIPIQKTYTYDGVAASQPIVNILFHYQQPYIYYYLSSGGGCMFLGNTTRDICTSTSNFPLSIMNGAPLVYSQVTEYSGTEEENIGKTVYVFMPPPGVTLLSQPINHPRFLSICHFDRGIPNPLLVRKEIYKNDNGIYKIINKAENVYDYLQTNEFITGLKVGQIVTYVNTSIDPLPDPCWVNDYMNSFDYEDTKGYQDVPVLTKTTVSDYAADGTSLMTTETDYAYDVTTLQRTRRTVINSKKQILKTEYKYPKDFITADPYGSMVNRNQLTPIIQQVEYKNDKLLRYTKTNYKAWGNNIIAPEVIEAQTLNNMPQVRLRYFGYDNNGNVLSVAKEKDVRASYIYDYNQTYAIAQVSNATPDQVAYSSFEADGIGGWTINSGQVINNNNDAVTGINTFSGSLSKSFPTVGNYIVTLWSKPGGAVAVNGSPGVLLNDNGPGGWQLFQWDLKGVSTVTVNGDNIDEVRLYPSNAQMTTYSYKPLVGMTSQCDINNRILFYDYDDLGRLLRVKDIDKNIIKKLEYQYQSVAGYVSASKNGTFTRNNCGSGYVGGQVTYTVAAGTYVSSVSQTDADQQAQANVTSNGQAYANSNGACRLEGVYYNVQKVGSFVRSCSNGYIGSSVAYIVPAATYSSTISQTDADQKAQDDVNANGQPYADAHGTCTAPTVNVYFDNATSQSFNATYTNISTGTAYHFVFAANTYGVTVGQIPFGTYNVSITPSSGTTLYYMSVYNHAESGVNSLSAYNINFNCNCGYVEIGPY